MKKKKSIPNNRKYIEENLNIYRYNWKIIQRNNNFL